MKSSIFKKACLALGTSTMFLLILQNARAQSIVSFSEGTFNNSDWVETPYTNGNGGSSSAVQISSDGNPGSYYQVTTSVNSGPACGAGIYLRNGFAYNPALQGAINSIDYSVDLIALASYGEAELTLSQNGNIYFGPELYNTGNSWMTLTQTNLVATNFNLLIFSSTGGNGELHGDSTSHPDFSAAGAVINFGFIVPDSTMSTGYTTVGGVDNYTVVLHCNSPIMLSIISTGAAALNAIATGVASNQTVVLQSSTNLTHWLPFQTNIGNGGPLTFTNVLNPAYPARFFRAVTQQ